MKDIFSRYVQIHNYIRIFLRLLKKSLMENFIFLCNETNYDQGSGYLKRVIWFIHLSITMMFVKGLQQLFLPALPSVGLLTSQVTVIYYTVTYVFSAFNSFMTEVVII